MKINILDLFSGIGGFSKGFIDAGFEIENHYFSEIDLHAIANYKYNFKHSQYVGTVEHVYRGGIERPHVITFGSPCFTADTKVLSTDGFVNIQDIKVGDKVLTHKGRWQNVYQTNVKEYDGYIHTIKLGKDTEEIKCTPEHPFYVVEKHLEYNSKKRIYDISWSKPKWVSAKDLTDNHHVVIASQKEDIESNMTESEAYLFGYYLAEGWLDKCKRKRDGKPMYRIYFAMHEDEEKHFLKAVSEIKYTGRSTGKKNIAVSISDKFEGRAIRATISNEYLYKLFSHAGDNSLNKVVPASILTAPLNIQQKFIEGYMYGDGSFNKVNKTYTATSKNISMAYGLRHLVTRVYNELPNIFFTEVESKSIINGREVNQRPYYTIRWKLDKAREVFSYRVEDNLVVKVVKNEKRRAVKPVYNFSVEGDNTYSVGNYVVHNCQDFSLAGKRKGLDGDRSSLIEHAITAISHFRPDVFVWENVKGAFSSNNSEDFWAIIQAFANIGGYTIEWQLLNTAWLLPQNRERIYLIGYLATSKRNWGEVFPIREDDAIFNSKDNTERRRQQTQNCTSLTGDSFRATNTFISAPTISKTLTGGGNSGSLHSDMTTIKINANTKKGFELAGYGDSINYSIPNSKTRRGRVGKGVAQTLDCSCNQAVIGSIRGRNPDNSSDRHAAINLEQTLEINKKNISNTLTSVQKDNVVVTKNYLQWDVSGKGHKSQQDRAFFENGNMCALSVVRAETKVNNLTNEMQLRRLTEIECERLQGFPDNFTKFGCYPIEKISAKKFEVLPSIDKIELFENTEVREIASTQRYKMLGNAVTRDVVELIARKLYETTTQ